MGAKSWSSKYGAQNMQAQNIEAKSVERKVWGNKVSIPLILLSLLLIIIIIIIIFIISIIIYLFIYLFIIVHRVQFDGLWTCMQKKNTLITEKCRFAPIALRHSN